MDKNSTNTETLIQYLDGDLQGEPLLRTEQEVASSLSLQQELEELRATRAAVKRYGLQQQIKTIHKEMVPQAGTIPMHPRARTIKLLRVSAAVAAALILVLGITTLYQYRHLSPETLFRDNYQSYSLRESRGAASSLPLQNAYKNGNWNEAISQFRQLAAPSAEDYFLAGNAFMRLDKPSEAINCFLLLQKKNATQQAHILEEDTEYYLAMSYLENKQSSLAIPLFEKIHRDQAHLYHDKVNGRFLRKLYWLRSGQ